MLVPGATEMLRLLGERGVVCYLASGTDRVYVEDEAAALGVTGYFTGGIYGAIDDYKSYSKEIVIADILRTHGIRGDELAVFGDGPVEIQNARSVGGIAVAVATDEAHPGQVDPLKRPRLLKAGADILIARFPRERAAGRLPVRRRMRCPTRSLIAAASACARWPSAPTT